MALLLLSPNARVSLPPNIFDGDVTLVPPKIEEDMGIEEVLAFPNIEDAVPVLPNRDDDDVIGAPPLAAGVLAPPNRDDVPVLLVPKMEDVVVLVLDIVSVLLAPPMAVGTVVSSDDEGGWLEKEKGEVDTFPKGVDKVEVVVVGIGDAVLNIDDNAAGWSLAVNSPAPAGAESNPDATWLTPVRLGRDDEGRRLADEKGWDSVIGAGVTRDEEEEVEEDNSEEQGGNGDPLSASDDVDDARPDRKNGEDRLDVEDGGRRVKFGFPNMSREEEDDDKPPAADGELDVDPHPN